MTFGGALLHEDGKIVSVNTGGWHFEHVEPEIFCKAHASHGHLPGLILGRIVQGQIGSALCRVDEVEI